MESLEELKRWDDYRVWMRKYLKLMSGEPETFYVSKARIDFQINGKPWMGHAVLLGKKSRMLSQKMRQEGCLFLEGTCSSDGKKVTIKGFSEKFAVGAERLFRKLKLGFDIVPGDAPTGAGAAGADPLEARWKARKTETFPRIKTALTSKREDIDELKKRAKPMTAAERDGDWAKALKALDHLLEIVDGGRRPLSAEENERLAQLTPAELAKQDLTAVDPKGLFTDEYMTELTRTKMKGAGNEDLKDIMRQLEKGASGKKRLDLIERLTPIVGNPPDAKKLDLDYGRFLVLRDQQAAVQKQKKKEAVPNLAEDLHPEFMASQPQLLFGKVVGDAFGIHPVFGALLSPTGGLVGPGNLFVEAGPISIKARHMDDDDPTGYHGIFHDAAGYLRNYHDQGPGYDYLDEEDNHSTDDPLTGQQSGMRYWHEKLDPGLKTTVLTGMIDVGYFVKDVKDEGVEAYGRRKLDEFQVEVEKKLKGARDTVADELDKALAKADRKIEEAKNDLERKALEVAEAARVARDTVEQTAVQTYDDASEALGTVRDEARRQLNAAWDYVWN